MDSALTAVAIAAIVVAGATPYFLVFWRWFDYWRKHQLQTYMLMLGTLGALAVVVIERRAWLFSFGLAMPLPARVVGWILVIASTVLGVVADRQLGIRIRSFTPFFAASRETIALRTNGAYGIVRHPIYAAGIWFQLGIFLVTGYWTIAVALVVLALGALWFTRQEERRLIALLDDPDAYARYRERVGALIPKLW